jgi:beta-galactosidase
MYKAILSLLLTGIISCAALGQGRSVGRIQLSVTEQWSFLKMESDPRTLEHNVHWPVVNLPHTWNSEDVLDARKDYYRGNGWYKKQLDLSRLKDKKELFLQFEAADQETEVWVNGKKAGFHAGGYTAFTVRITDLVNRNAGARNEVVVRVTNRFNESIPPLTADFTFYGGIYREVHLVGTDAVHVTFPGNMEKGVQISTPVVTHEKAQVQVQAELRNESNTARQIRLVSQLKDREGKLVGSVESEASADAQAMLSVRQQFNELQKPHLWSPESPYLYTVITQVKDAVTGEVLDRVQHSVGLRSFRFSADSGFFLNGQPVKLMGASRHQDYKGLGNAVPKQRAVKDIQLLKQMGANFFRTAHYPQDQAVLDACDRLGLLVATEIPVVNTITETDFFFTNCLAMQKELVRQYFNHPSIIIWGYMNEVLLRPKYNGDKARQASYFESVAALARALDSLTRSEDPSRYTMIVNHGDLKRYKETGLTAIPMIVGWNLYSGWYGGQLSDFGKFLDRHHQELPDKPMLVTEFGADADPRIRSRQPERFDKSIEYALQFNQIYLKEIKQRPFVAGALSWILADFNSETREETMPHMNNKGLMEWDRKPKDLYFYYQSQLVKHPFLKISRDPGTLSSDSLHTIRVFTNGDEVQLMVNDRTPIRVSATNGIAQVRTVLRSGWNQISARTEQGLQDSARIYYQPYPDQLEKGFKSLAILLGAKRQFIDSSKRHWIEDRPYREGSWGSVGGQPFTIPGSSRQSYGTDKAIAQTENDPVYQTQQTGIEAYRFDVPPGNYELILHFAELEGGEVMVPAYNLRDTSRTEVIRDRIFDVAINGKTVLKDFNIAGQYGRAVAVKKVFKLSVNNTGLVVRFTAKTGAPVLNAIELKPIK